MTRDPRDTSAEEPDGGNLQVRFRRGPGSGNRPGLLNISVFPQRRLRREDPRSCTRAGAGLVALWVLASAAPAAAHRFAPSLLHLAERERGEVAVLFKSSPLASPALRPIVPCRASAPQRTERTPAAVLVEWRLDCGAGGLAGKEIRAEGITASGPELVVVIERAGDAPLQVVLRAGAPAYVVPAATRPLGVARDYLLLGVRHILSGVDHLLFVLCLILLVRGRRAVAATVTCFTIGHSITLSLAALGHLSLPSAPTEAAIAASILLLAAELLRRLGGHAPTLAGRYPFAAALAFGLLHGLGFAGALLELGMPARAVPVALACFNLGVEVGQLIFVGMVLAISWALARAWRRRPAWAPRLVPYLAGTCAGYFCVERVVGFFGA